MRTMLTLQELATWAREDEAAVVGDPFAQQVIEAASFKVADTASHLDWIDDVTAAQPEYRARLIAILLATRSYKNPDSVVAEGSIGPIGGDRRPEDLARFLELTEQETIDLQKMAPTTSSGGGLYGIDMVVAPGPGPDDTVWAANSPYVGSDAFPMGSTYDAAAYGV